MRENQSHSGAAYDVILDLILSGALPPEAPISIRSLADRTGIGRTPIREALQALARDGVIAIVPMRGTFVRKPDIVEVREIYEVRIALEGMAAFLVAQRGLSERLRQIGADMKAMKDFEQVDLELIRKLGWDLHDELMAAAENSQLKELYVQISRKFKLILRQGARYDDRRYIETLDEHLEIFAALEAKDASRAQELMQAHIRRAFMARVKALYDPTASSNSGTELRELQDR